MTATDLLVLAPLLLLAATAVVVMVAVAVRRSHRASVSLTLLGLLAAFVSLWVVYPFTPRQIGGLGGAQTKLLVMDHYALFYIGLILAATAAVVIFSYGYFSRLRIDPDEVYLLLLLGATGSAVLVASNHFVSFFLGLEILSVSLYALCAYVYTRKTPLEAGIKYLVLAAASAAFLLFGMALIYAELGTLEFGRMATLFAGGPAPRSALLLGGWAMLITGVGFKLAVVPFHLWTPDVYEGAPAPVTAFLATVSKGGMFALLLRYVYGSGAMRVESVFLVFAVIAVASMIVGNLLALLQNNVKRILAYSSIAHLGYLLVAFQAGGELAMEAVTFYLVAYFVTTLGAFGVVSLLADSDGEKTDLADYRGLFWRRPLLSGIFTAMLLSLAGIPLTAGFLGKYYILLAGASARIWALLFVLVVASAIGLFYYLRIIVALYADAEQRAPAAAPSLSWAGNLLLVVLAVLLIWFGTFPSSLLEAIRTATAGLS